METVNPIDLSSQLQHDPSSSGSLKSPATRSTQRQRNTKRRERSIINFSSGLFTFFSANNKIMNQTNQATNTVGLTSLLCRSVFRLPCDFLGFSMRFICKKNVGDIFFISGFSLAKGKTHFKCTIQPHSMNITRRSKQPVLMHRRLQHVDNKTGTQCYIVGHITFAIDPTSWNNTQDKNQPEKAHHRSKI